ncbi:MAG: DUF1761 domain-containing protein [Promethearchaeota archaeon]
MAFEVNWLAVSIVALIYFAIHFFWYFPSAFGNLWLKLVGKEGEPKSKIIKETIIMIPLSFITVLVIDVVMILIGISEIGPALLLSLLLWIGFVATIGINQSNFNDRGMKLFLLEYIVYLIAFLIAGSILVIWK